MFEKQIYSDDLLFGASFCWCFLIDHHWLVMLETQGDPLVLEGCSSFSRTEFIVPLPVSSLCRGKDLTDHNSNLIAAYFSLVMESAWWFFCCCKKIL